MKNNNKIITIIIIIIIIVIIVIIMQAPGFVVQNLGFHAWGQSHRRLDFTTEPRGKWPKTSSGT